VLGVDDKYNFQDNTISACRTGDIILIGTDGIDETRDKNEQIFGHQRLERIIRRHAHDSAAAIKQAIVEEVKAFRGELAQEDDITLVIIKAL
jgi:sigma-B regulation protein RsbU (phosphoserine phosphatase)